jgi:hypothetical protein
LLYLAAAVAIAIAVLLVLVLVLPNLVGSGSGSGSAAAVLTYSGARPVADRTAGGFAGGGWTLLFAAGLVSATAVSVPSNTSALGNITGCTFTLVGNIAGLSLPAYAGNRSSGAAPAWEFGYRNSSDTIAIVSVIDGQGMVLATLTGFECSLYAQLFSPVPADVINSSAAAAAVEPKAASFLAEYPNASAEFALVGGVSIFGHGIVSEWSVMYSTCALSPSATGTGAGFNATVNAVTGAVLGSNTTSNESCSSAGTPTEVANEAPVAMPTAAAAGQRSGRSS